MCFAGAHIAITPADWLVHAGGAPATAALNEVRDAARASHVAIALASVNTNTQRANLTIVSSEGVVLLDYSKPSELHSSSVPVAGDIQPPVVLNLSNGVSVTMGGLLRTDLLFPEPARLLMLGGAEIMVVPSGPIAGPLRSDALELFVRSRARENSAAVFAATSASDNVSSAWSAQGFCPSSDGKNSQQINRRLATLTAHLTTGSSREGEGIVYATVDIARLREGRTRTTTGDNYRRPFDYTPLCFDSPSSEDAPEVVADTKPLHDANNGGVLAPQELVVALLQMRPNTTFVPRDHSAELVAKADDLIRRAAASGADVALLPEMWSVGYEALFPCEPNNECDDTGQILKWMRLATPLNGGYIAHFRSLARELDMAIAATYMEEVTGPGGDPWPPRNSVALIDRHGNVVYNYAKVHTCQFSGLEALHTGGRAVYSGVLDTKSGNVTVASIICFDREQMEVARMATQVGAEVLLTPNACGLDNSTLDHFSVRGMENAMAVTMTNYADVPQWRDATNGRSIAFDHLGHPLAVAAGDEGVYLARIDVTALRAHRQSLFARALVDAAAVLRPGLCDLPRRPEFGGEGALGRMSVPL